MSKNTIKCVEKYVILVHMFHSLFCNFTIQNCDKVSKPQTKSSALHEKEGVPPPETVNPVSMKTIQNFRKKVYTTDDYIKGILKKDITVLSRAITLVESTNPDHLAKANEVIQACLPYANKSIRMMSFKSMVRAASG